MIYECDECEAVLAPGLLACPRCGQPFEDPVPWDAEVEGVQEPARRGGAWRTRLSPLAVGGILMALTLFGTAGTIAYRRITSPKPAVSVGSALPINHLPTDIAAHPRYSNTMKAFVLKLRATGGGAQWPAFGSSDILLITPPAIVDGKRADWDQETCQRLAQGIWGYFTHYRYECGFSDTDSTTCFVIVSSASGQVVAADLMGNIK